MSRTPGRAFVAAFAAIAGVLSLSGCLEFGAIAAKTDAIHEQLADLPGVTGSSVQVTENSAFSARRSAVYLDVSPDVTADQVVTMITTFAHANIETGVDKVSAELHLVLETATMRNELEVDYAGLTDETAAALGETWIDLLASADGASIVVAAATATGHSVEVNLALGGEPTIERDLAALAGAADIFGRLGQIRRYSQDDGRFAATDDLPSDAAIAQLATVQAAAVSVGGDITAEYGGLAHQNFIKVIVPVAASAVDAATGLPTSIETVVDSVTADAFPMLFTVNDEVESIDGITGITFTNADCGPYPTLIEIEPSRTLLQYWARDGRTLLDGSTVASCFT
jgi:hypothetical protein